MMLFAKYIAAYFIVSLLCLLIDVTKILFVPKIGQYLFYCLGSFGGVGMPPLLFLYIIGTVIHLVLVFLYFFVQATYLKYALLALIILAWLLTGYVIFHAMMSV